MKIVTAIDSFKGSLSSMEAGTAAKEGILLADPEAEVVVKPLADYRCTDRRYEWTEN